MGVSFEVSSAQDPTQSHRRLLAACKTEASQLPLQHRVCLHAAMSYQLTDWTSELPVSRHNEMPSFVRVIVVMVSLHSNGTLTKT